MMAANGRSGDDTSETRRTAGQPVAKPAGALATPDSKGTNGGSDASSKQPAAAKPETPQAAKTGRSGCAARSVRTYAAGTPAAAAPHARQPHRQLHRRSCSNRCPVSCRTSHSTSHSSRVWCNRQQGRERRARLRPAASAAAAPASGGPTQAPQTAGGAAMAPRGGEPMAVPPSALPPPSASPKPSALPPVTSSVEVAAPGGRRPAQESRAGIRTCRRPGGPGSSPCQTRGVPSCRRPAAREIGSGRADQGRDSGRGTEAGTAPRSRHRSRCRTICWRPTLEVGALLTADLRDSFGFLGMHRLAGDGPMVVRVFLPWASAVTVRGRRHRRSDRALAEAPRRGLLRRRHQGGGRGSPTA